jgi:DNA polymerase-3 subunit delta'
MKFSEIPGLGDTKQLLVDAIRENHLAHAQLFAGAEGALNLPLALACATYLHCENRGVDACGKCPACSKSLKYIHPDTHFVFPVSNIKQDKDEERFKAEILKSWRSFLLETPFGNPDDWTNFYGGENKQALISRDESREIIKSLALKPFESSFKVMIIWQPELMHPSAANGILKILEEPPQHTYFILVTNAADRLLPTIISRTQLLAVPMLDDDELAAWISASRKIDIDDAKKIAQLADGNLASALKLSEGEQNDHLKRFTEWVYACYKHDYGTLVAMADEYHSLDKVNQRNLLTYSLNMMHETMLDLFQATGIHRVRQEELEFVRRFAGQMNLKKIERAYTLINDAGYHLERNGSAKMIFLDLSLKLAETFMPAEAPV